MAKSEFVLEMKNIEKQFSGTKVLKGINLQVRSGEIHAILGENGAGKSTLMNVLFGMSVIHSTGGFSGEVLWEGESIHIKSPIQAMNLGIGMVHQEFMLIPSFTATENIKINREITKPNIISRIFGKQLKTLDMPSMQLDARKSMDTVGLGIDELARVAGLPVGYMQFIEIAREIDKENVKLLVFDEPTAVLTESEAAKLLNAMQDIAARGIAILFITHRLEEVMLVANTVTILRDGELVRCLPKKETDIFRLAEMMVGRTIERLVKQESSQRNSETAISIRNLRVMMPGEQVRHLDLDVYQGEILGIGGLSGQGKIGIANGIMGMYPSSGEVNVDGQQLKLNNPRAAYNAGLAFVSEDRRGVGLLLDSSIELNIAFTAMQIHNRFLLRFGMFSQIDSKEIRNHALQLIKQLDIRCTGPAQLSRRLSGGNQQKVCIARSLALNPKVLFVSEPTRGIDVGAKRLVMETLVELNQKLGMTIIMTSSELAELRSICHRIAIVSGGTIEGILQPEDSDVDFGLMMAGDYQRLRSRGEVSS